MYEILKKQFDSGNVFNRNKNHGLVKWDRIPKYYWEMYPLAQDYYHELNPFFLIKAYEQELLKFADVYTVRDGYLTFMEFILNNYPKLSKMKGKLFLIHKELATLIPPNLSHLFATWTLSHPNQTELSKSKKVLIFGYVCNHYLGNQDEFPLSMKGLKNIHPDAVIEVYTPQRRNIFLKDEKENLIMYHFLSHLKDALPSRNLRFLTNEQFFEKTDLKGTYIYDLAEDNFMVSDNYLHYYAISRGATVSSISSKIPKDSVFDLALSFNHELHVSPLPTVDNIFSDILFYTKTSGRKDYLYDPILHSMLKTHFKKVV